MEVKNKIENKTAVTAIVGRGYVGLPHAVEIAGAGMEVIGLDVQEKRVAILNHGESYISDVSKDALEKIIAAGKFKASADFSLLASADVIIVCVPTPLDKYKIPDISYITAAANEVKKYLRRGQLVIADGAGGRVVARLATDGSLRAKLSRLSLQSLASWLPALADWQAEGHFDGEAEWLDRGGAERIRVRGTLTGGGFSSADGLRAGEALNEIMASLGADRQWLLALRDECIIGMANVSRQSPRPRMRHRAVMGVSVSRDYWSMGIGRALMRWVITWCRAQGFEQLELGVFAHNLRARHLYESLGFVLTHAHHPPMRLQLK